jgi:dTDP-4-amino-4,6-dideoxygalactose transaminase
MEAHIKEEGAVAETLACQGGAPVRSRPYPAWPVWDEREERALLEVLRSGRWGELDGGTVALFEERFAAFQEARFCIAVTNGTAALRVAFRALGLGPGDEVIVPPYTFIATASAALEVGALPIFADIDPETYLLDPAAAEAAITPRTRAVVPVHVAGCPGDMDAFRALAARHDLRLVEDAAQAHGASWNGQGVGALGDLGTFSFQASKNLTAGEGGAVVTDDEELAEVVWSLHNVGRVRTGAWYWHELLGSNERLTAFQAALLLAQMERLPEQMARREAAAAYLNRALAAIEGLRPLWRDPRVTAHAHHLYIFRYDAEAFGGLERDAFVRALRAEGIPCSSGYTPLNTAPALREAVARLRPLLGRDDDPLAVRVPRADRACAEGIWLPQYVLLGSEEDLHDIVRAIHKVQRLAGALVHS